MTCMVTTSTDGELTIAEVKHVIPQGLQSVVTQELVDRLNLVSKDPSEAVAIRETFMGYTQVLKEGKFKLEDYLNASAFVSYRLMGYNQKESWERTFPDRYMAMFAAGKTDKEISATVSHYSKTKLVNMIFEQTMIPVWVMNQDVFQQAVDEQLKLMTTARSEMVRMQAANSIMTHLKPPEKKQIELAITTPENSGMNALRDMLTAVAARQIELIKAGATTREVAHQKLHTGIPADLGDNAMMIDVTPVQTESPD